MSHLRRLCALAAASTLAVAGLTVAGSPAQAATPDPRPVTIGAGWLEGQLTNGIFNGSCTYDCGSTIDAGFALDAVGEDDAVDAVATAIGPKIANGYAVSDEYDFNPPYDFKQTGIYAGALAKSIVFAQTAGVGNLTTWSGRDLLGDLEGRVSATSGIEGRITDDSFYGNYANNIGQAFAVAALAAASSSKADEALDFLLTQQCSEGYFRLNPAALDASDPGETCEEGKAGDDSPADPDTTSTAIRMLAPQAGDPDVAAALTKAEDWLLSVQRVDGSFGGGTSTESANTNSTGLAGWALGVRNHEAAAAEAAAWVRSHQADEPTACPSQLSAQTGALSYDDAALAAGRTDGITNLTKDQWRRSTAQALPVLQWAPEATAALDLAGPSGYLKAGSVARYQVTGASPGATVCVSGAGTPRRVAAPASGSFTVALTLPAGTANRVVTASVREGSSTSLLAAVLGAKTLRVRPARDIVHRGARLRVVVRGLAPAERVTLRLRGVTVRTGVANTEGRFVRYVRVGREVGRARIVAWGQFPTIRHGRAVIRVVR
jgi:hypothetical protein